MPKVFLRDICADLADFEFWVKAVSDELGQPVLTGVDNHSRIFMDIPDKVWADYAKCHFDKSR